MVRDALARWRNSEFKKAERLLHLNHQSGEQEARMLICYLEPDERGLTSGLAAVITAMAMEMAKNLDERRANRDGERSRQEVG